MMKSSADHIQEMKDQELRAKHNEKAYRAMIADTDLIRLGRIVVDNISDYVYVYTYLHEYALRYGVNLAYVTINERGNLELMYDIFRRLAVVAYVDSVQP